MKIIFNCVKISTQSTCISFWKYNILILLLTFFITRYDMKKKSRPFLYSKYTEYWTRLLGHTVNEFYLVCQRKFCFEQKKFDDNERLFIWAAIEFRINYPLMNYICMCNIKFTFFTTMFRDVEVGPTLYSSLY